MDFFEDLFNVFNTLIDSGVCKRVHWKSALSNVYIKDLAENFLQSFLSTGYKVFYERFQQIFLYKFNEGVHASNLSVILKFVWSLSHVTPVFAEPWIPRIPSLYKDSLCDSDGSGRRPQYWPHEILHPPVQHHPQCPCWSVAPPPSPNLSESNNTKLLSSL